MADRSSRVIDVKHQTGFGLIAVLCILVLYLPIVVIAAFSFNNSQSIGASWGGFSTRWYTAVFHNDAFFNATWLSFLIAGLAMVFSTVLATAAALGTTRGKPWKGQGTAFMAITIPLVVPEIVMGISLLAFFAFIAQATGIKLGLWRLILSHTAFCIPFAYLPIRGRLESMDITLENAASDLYASRWQVFRYVTMPLLAPAITSGAALAFIVSFDDFTITQLIAGPGETTLPLFIWGKIRNMLTPELNAMCTLLLIVSLAFVVLSFVLSRKKDA